jgi:hypothetical protein
MLVIYAGLIAQIMESHDKHRSPEFELFGWMRLCAERCMKHFMILVIVMLWPNTHFVEYFFFSSIGSCLFAQGQTSCGPMPMPAMVHTSDGSDAILCLRSDESNRLTSMHCNTFFSVSRIARLLKTTACAILTSKTLDQHSLFTLVRRVTEKYSHS